MTTQNLVHGSDAGRWEQAIYAFSAEKERRSGSMRTVRAYSGMLYRFFGNVGKQPDQVTSPEVFGYAHGIGLSGKEPSSVTINARIACLSSFYRFLIRMSLVSANPCDQLERPRATPALPRGLTAADIKKLLDFIPDNPVGLRDRAIILTLILTGRRRAEVLNLKVSDLIQDGEAVYYSYRGKGGKHGKRELPRPAFRAIQQALAAFGKDLAAMKPEESLWPSSADSGRGITSGTFYGNLLRYFKAAGLMPAGVHIFRHSAAKLRREAGESVEQVSRFLDHSSLAVTTVYLRQLEGDRDTAWEQVAENLGLTPNPPKDGLGTALEEAIGCSSESGIMVLEQKPARKQGAPNRCRHITIPTVSASSLTTIAWWPMPACSCRPPSPGTWACGNSSTITLTSAARRDGRTLGTRC